MLTLWKKNNVWIEQRYIVNAGEWSQFDSDWNFLLCEIFDPENFHELFHSILQLAELFQQQQQKIT